MLSFLLIVKSSMAMTSDDVYENEPIAVGGIASRILAASRACDEVRTCLD